MTLFFSYYASQKTSFFTDSANTSVQAWIGSVSEPTNTTGLINQQLPAFQMLR